VQGHQVLAQRCSSARELVTLDMEILWKFSGHMIYVYDIYIYMIYMYMYTLKIGREADP